MRNKRGHREKGEILEPILILLALSIIIFVFVLPARKPGAEPSIFSFTGTPNPVSTYNNKGNTSANNTGAAQTLPNGQPAPMKNSTYAGDITLGTGNASYTYEPFQEYVELYNEGSAPTPVSGWKMTNARGTRAYTVGTTEEYFPTTQVVIPQGSPYLSPTGPSPLENIVLEPGQDAIVTTGSVGLSIPYKITSFEENECSGYIQALPDYENSFTPSLNENCVEPSREPGVSGLDQACQNFIENMPNCHTPTYNTVNHQGNQVDSTGNTCNGCVDGQGGLSNSCVAFLEDHYSYAGCLVNHVNDPNFESGTWRIFLNQPLELWASKNETVSLFDQFNRLVDYQSY